MCLLANYVLNQSGFCYAFGRILGCVTKLHAPKGFKIALKDAHGGPNGSKTSPKIRSMLDKKMEAFWSPKGELCV